MPISNELVGKLQQRKEALSAIRSTPSPCSNVEKADLRDESSEVKILEAHVDKELIHKLQQRRTVVRRQETADELKEVEVAPAPLGRSFKPAVDAQLLERLRQRKSAIQQQEAWGSTTPKPLQPSSPASAEKSKEDDGSAFRFSAPIDNELVAKMQRRRIIIQEQEEGSIPAQAPEAPQIDEDDEHLSKVSSRGIPDELAQKLARRRKVVNAEGDHFQKGEDGGIVARKQLSQLHSEAAAPAEVGAEAEQSQEEALVEPKRRGRCHFMLPLCSVAGVVGVLLIPGLAQILASQ